MFAKPFPILFIAPLDVGEAVAVSGLVPRLIQEIPGATLTIVAGPASAPLFAEAPDARIILADSYEGLPARLGLAAKLRKHEWGLVADMGGADIGGWLKRRRRATKKPGPWRGKPTLEAARLVGFDDDPPLPFLYTTDDQEEAADNAILGDGSVMAVGPGADWVGRIWPPERYGQIATQLMLAPRAPLANGRIVAFGSEKHRDAMQTAVFPLPRKRIIQRPSNQSLLTDYAWLKRCRLYIGGDNIWTLLAAAAGCPTVAIYGPSDDEIIAPVGDHVRVVRGPRDYETLRRIDPTFSQQISLLNDLPMENVLTAARGLLLKTRDPNG